MLEIRGLHRTLSLFMETWLIQNWVVIQYFCIVLVSSETESASDIMLYLNLWVVFLFLNINDEDCDVCDVMFSDILYFILLIVFYAIYYMLCIWILCILHYLTLYTSFHICISFSSPTSLCICSLHCTLYMSQDNPGIT